jgi:putative hemolysin
VTTAIWDVVIVLVIMCIGGFFASAEMALVSLREGQVQSIASHGKRGAKAARLAADPNRFLASVQIGTTLATLVTGAYGANTLAGLLNHWLPPGGLRGRHGVHHLRQPRAQ